jgi:hypothetical protein
MSEAGLRKLELPDFIASIRKGTPALIVEAESEIPSDHWIPPRTPSPKPCEEK